MPNCVFCDRIYYSGMRTHTIRTHGVSLPIEDLTTLTEYEIDLIKKTRLQMPEFVFTRTHLHALRVYLQKKDLDHLLAEPVASDKCAYEEQKAKLRNATFLVYEFKHEESIALEALLDMLHMKVSSS